MFNFGIPELLMVLAIVLLVFGGKRIKNLGNDLGSAIKGFKSSMKESEADDKEEIIEAKVEANEETDKNNAIFMFRVGSTTLAKRAVSEEKFKSEVQTITDDSWVLPERTKSVVYKDSRQINLERLKSY